MRLVGFNFTKIEASRPEVIQKIEKITQEFNFVDFFEDSFSIMKESTMLKVKFKYTVYYEPHTPKIEIEGIAMLNGESKEVKNTIKDWKKKRLNEELRIYLTKTILNKCALKALNLEEEMNIPTHQKLINIQSSK